MSMHSRFECSPKSLEIHPTLACNLKCRYCSLRILERYETISDVATGLGIPLNRITNNPFDGRLKIEEFVSKAHISLERSLKLIAEAGALGIGHFKISGGGEPLCRPDYIFALIKEMVTGGATVELITNGTLLEAHVDSLIESGLSNLSISIDAASSKILDMRRGKIGTFSLITKAIRKINSLKKELNLRTPRLQIYAVLDEESIEYILGLLEFAQKNEIEKINFILRKDADELHPKEFDRIASFAQGFSVATNIMDIISADRVKIASSPTICSRPFNDIVVHGNGLVSPCCSMTWGVGEFIQERSLEQIWNGDIFKGIRESFINGGYPKYCLNCKETKIGKYSPS